MDPATNNPHVDYKALAKLLKPNLSDPYKVIVEAPYSDKVAMALLFVGFICIYTVDEEKDEIKLMAASGTEEYRLAIERYNFKPSDYRLNFEVDKDNTIVKAIATGKPQDTTDWVTLSRQGKSAEAVRFNQANSGIAYTAVYPFISGIRGAMMYNFYQYPDEIGADQLDFMQKYTNLVADYFAAK